MHDALVALHFQNDICDRAGKIPFSLNRDTAEAEAFLAASRRALEAARAAGWTIAHIHIGFAEDYADLPGNPKLFAKVREFGAVKRGSWGAAAFPGLRAARRRDRRDPRPATAAFATPASTHSSARRGVERLNVMGLATQFSVEHTVRDAADLDWPVRLLADCCASADMEAHRNTLRVLAMLAEVTTSTAVLPP